MQPKCIQKIRELRGNIVVLMFFADLVAIVSGMPASTYFGFALFGFASIILYQFRRLNVVQQKLRSVEQAKEEPEQRLRQLEIENETLSSQLDRSAPLENQMQKEQETNRSLRQEISALQTQIRSLQDREKELQSSLKQEKEKHLGRKETHQELQSELQGKTRAIDDLQMKCVQADKNAEQLRNQVAAEKEERERAVQAVKLEHQEREINLQNELDALKQRDALVESTEAKLARAMEQLNEWKQKAQKLEEENLQQSQSALRDVQILQNRNSELQTEVERLSKESEAREQESHTSDTADAESQIKELEALLGQEKEKTAMLLLEIEEKHVKAMHDDQKRHLEELNSHVEVYQNKVSALEEEKNRLLQTSSELDQLRAENEKLQNSLTDLQGANESLANAVAQWEMRFGNIEKAVSSFVGEEQSERDVEALVHSLTENLHSLQDELKHQRELTEQMKRDYEEEVNERRLSEQQKERQVEMLDKELVLMKQRSSEIHNQLEKEKEAFQKNHTELREAMQQIDELKGALEKALEGQKSPSLALPVDLPQSPDVQPSHEEIPVSIYDDDQVVDKILHESSEEENLLATPEQKAHREKLLRMRTHVLKEIYATEQNYVGILDMVYNEFIEPLKEAIKNEEPILTETELRTIFPSWEVIRGYNTLFLQQLKERIDKWEETQCVGDLFIEICIWLKSYSSYINTFDNANQKLQEVMERDHFKAFLNTPRSKKALKRQDLSSFLIAPVQRLPRYVLLLKELLKCTPTDHEDYNPLQQALEGITSIADTVNASKLLHESRELMLEFATRFVPSVGNQIVAPHRTYVGEGIFYRNPSTAEMDVENLTIKDIHILILFSDILVHARPNESFQLGCITSPASQQGRTKVTRMKSFDKKKIQETPQDLELKKIYKVSSIDIVPAEKQKLGLKIRDSKSTLLKVYARTEEDKCDWLLTFDATKKGIPSDEGRRRRKSLFR